MDEDKIKELLEKYYRGRSTLEEELLLREYFRNSENLSQLNADRELFNYFSETELENSSEYEFDEKILQELNMAPINIIKKKMHFWNWGTGIAASMASLIIGILIGTLNILPVSRSQDHELEALKSEIFEIKKKVMLSQLKQPLASERIKGVNYVYEFEETNLEIIHALSKVLKYDKNANVRIAAANALFEYRQIEVARKALINSLAIQTEPIVQIALIKILLDIDKKFARDRAQELLNDENSPDFLKEMIGEVI